MKDFWYKLKPMEYQVVYPTFKGVFHTASGLVEFDEKDIVVVVLPDARKLIYPEGVFTRSFEPLDRGDYGVSGVFKTKSRKVLAIEIHKGCELRLVKKKKIYHGKEGDFLIQDEDETMVVESEIFKALYIRSGE